MLPVLLAAFVLGIAAGLRTFTAPAILWIMRHGGGWAIVLAILAVAEYAGDMYPKAPARTGTAGLLARCASGAFAGWWLASAAGAAEAAGTCAGIAGALVGAYGGLAVRMKAISSIGAVPAALLEDAVAIALAVSAVSCVPA